MGGENVQSSEMQQGKNRFVAILLYCYAGKYKIIAF